ncbi:MAG: NAD(P)H-dependent oxidoreductase [Myxococcota bacterium]
MFIIDTALKARAAEHNPVRVGMIGAGFMGRGIVNQIRNAVPGMVMSAIYSRAPDDGQRAFLEAGYPEPKRVDSPSALDAAAQAGTPVITDDPSVLCRSQSLDALIEVTGTVEFAAHVVLDALEHRKHVVLMNAELDGTVGSILKRRADAAGVVLTACDGDQPGVEANLYRYVTSIGLEPLLVGNIKGLHDPYRNPTTQAGFAKKWLQKPHMVTSFADGTKMSFEQAIVANGFGLTVAQRGMLGYDFRGHVDEMTHLYDVDQLREWGGIVDYVVGAKPGPGVFIFATHEDPKQKHYLNLYKLGEGPLYSFYTPYHLCHFEVPLSVARVVLFNDTILAGASPRVDVVATAKVHLRAGDVLDGIGHYKTYGLAEKGELTHAQRLLPIGLAEGCTLLRDVPKDQVLTYDDVSLPEGRLIDRLRAEQDTHFFGSSPVASKGSIQARSAVS